MPVAVRALLMPSNRMIKRSLISAIVLALGAGAAPDAGEQSDKHDKNDKKVAIAASSAPAKNKPRIDAHAESPQQTVGDFLEYVRTGKDNIASTYLELTPKTKEQGPELARQLAAILQSQRSFEVDNLSPDWNGDTEDGLPETQEDIAHIAVEDNGAPQPVRLINHPESEPAWRFALVSVALIPAWYARTPNAWVTEHLPEWLQKRGPGGVQFWQWLGLLFGAVLAWAVGFGVSRLVTAMAVNIVKRTKTTIDDVIVTNLQGPIVLACSLGVAAAIAPLLDLPELPATMLFRVIKGGFLVVFFWVCMRAVDLVRDGIIRASQVSNQPSSRSLISLGARFTKALLFVILIIAVLSQLGFPVATLLAGLGIGGLAVALAGQKTLENLIGTFAIGIDQPFREGDFVKVRDFTGTVEAIGLRSTRFRTLDRTIISMPNGKLADEPIETYAARDRFRLFFSLPVRYGSSPEQLQSALTRLEAVLKSQPNVDAGSVSVKLTGLNEWSLGFEVLAMLNTANGDEFNLTRQTVLLRAMHELDEAGVTVQPSAAQVAASQISKRAS